MKPIDLGEIIADRELHLLDRPGTQIKVLIGRPHALNGGNEWRCPYQVVGIGDEVVRAGTGVDALQALQLVVTKAIPAWLSRLLEENPSLRWEDGDAGDFGFSL